MDGKPSENQGEDKWPRFIDDVCNQELEEDIQGSAMTFGNAPMPPMLTDMAPITETEDDTAPATEPTAIVTPGSGARTSTKQCSCKGKGGAKAAFKCSPKEADEPAPSVPAEEPAPSVPAEEPAPSVPAEEPAVRLPPVSSASAPITPQQVKKCKCSKRKGEKSTLPPSEEEQEVFVGKSELEEAKLDITSDMMDLDENLTPEEKLSKLQKHKMSLQEKVRRLEEVNKEKGDEIKELKATLANLQKSDNYLPSADGEKTLKKVPFEGTESEIEVSLAILKNKCRTKDQMITALANELKLRSASGVYENMLGNVVLDEMRQHDTPRDFDREQLCEFLDRPEGYSGRSPPPHPDPAAKECEDAKNNAQPRKRSYNEESAPIDMDIPSPPLDVEVVRRVGADSLLVAWKVAKGDYLMGYEIYVNGSLAQKVRSLSRNRALLQCLDLNSKVVITMYVVSDKGRCSNPACVVFPDPC